MQTLAEELKREDLKKIKEKGSQIKTEDVDSDWAKAKEAVIGLNDNVAGVIKKAYNQNRLTKYKSNKCMRYQVYFNPIHGHDVGFIAYEILEGEDKGDFKYAWYVAYNLNKNSVFKRDLVDTATPEDAQEIFNA